ncbi:hypothetical protein FDP41_010438 [Naegleria fowleri]|uniref:Beta-lactamase-related domain-containing protein n=1 Tax=Naegleria fowleri TaxID=5763 RepID=A0A6A5BZ07_NAEFO|nr:uncharacterized protein FDP41_010438 [Naegleria fowleri]KAF0983373.1 hypothetical protein FDP41_010438 [Naegleria fowleri]
MKKFLTKTLLAGGAVCFLMFIPFIVFLSLNAHLFPMFFTYSNDKALLNPDKHPSTVSELKDLLEKVVPVYLTMYNLPGVAIAVISESKVQYMKTFGSCGRALFDENTLFKVGSLSKTFTAWGVMTLVQKGLIQLDDPIQKHMHSYTLPPPYNPG